MVDRIGQQLGNYHLKQLLGKGGFASVYLGEHIYLETQVAIKVHEIPLTNDDREKFLNEARTIAHLKHHNIIRVLEFGIEQNNPFLVMDYASHGTLRRLYPKGSRLSLTVVLPYVKQIASALQYAHDQKLVHRDVKPENFLLGANNEVLLSDFGIAIATQNSRSMSNVEDVIAGTAAYMAPEQLEGKTRPASDQYALGIVVYEWLCGRPPFQGSFVEISLQHLNAPPRSLHEQVPEISPATEIVIQTALAKDPQQRFASVSAFANALDQVYRLENPNQSLNKLVLPGIATSLPTSSIHSVPTEEQPLTQYPLPAINPIEDLPTILMPPVPDDTKKIAPTLQIISRDKCSICHVEFPPGSAFCFNCGVQVTSSVTPPGSEEDFIQTLVSARTSFLLSPSSEKCPFCGAETRSGDKFCLNCGNNLSRNPASDHEQPAKVDNTLLSLNNWAELAHAAPIADVDKENPRQGTIADRFEPTFAATMTEPEGEEHSLMALPSPIQIDSYSGQSLAQIKEQLLAEGDEYYQAKQYVEAFNAYQRIIQLDAQDVRAHGRKGNALGRLGRYKDALEAYTAALDIDASHPSIWSAKGDMLAKQRNYHEALSAYNQALTLNPKDALTWKTKGNLLAKLRNYDEALAAYSSALDFKPEDATAWAIKGNLYYKLGQYEEALRTFTRSLDLAPKKSAVWEARGDALSKLRRYNDALIAYERAYILNPGNASLLHKCEMHRELKQQQEELAQAQKTGLKTQILRSDLSHRRSSSPPPQPDVRKEKTGDQTQIIEVFDVFLSYSEEDASWVEELAKRLADEGGCHVWLDKWILIPGEPWISARAEAIEQARSCVVCIGETTPINWFEQEIQKAIHRQKREPNSTFRVIPVLLPNAKSDDVRANLKNFLELNVWIDFRKFDYDYAFHLLMSGIRGEAPGRWPREEVAVFSKEMIAEKKLRQLKRFSLEGIVDDSLVVEYQRQVLAKLWLSAEENIDE